MVVQFVHGGLFCSRLCCCLKCWDGGLGVGLEGRGRKRAKRRTRTKKCARIKKGVSMCAWKSDGTLGSKRALAASWMATRDFFDLSVKRKKKRHRSNRLFNSSLPQLNTKQDERPLKTPRTKGKHGESEQARTQSVQQTTRERQHHCRTRCRGTFIHSFVAEEFCWHQRSLIAQVAYSQRHTSYCSTSI